AAVADTTVVVLTPNLGDGVQMIKAGILEIADIFVVNKADLEGHHRAVTELRSMLSLSNFAGAPKQWKPPIIATSATKQEGIDQLWDAILAHRRHLESSGRADELARKRLEAETVEVAAEVDRDSRRLAVPDDRGVS